VPLPAPAARPGGARSAWTCAAGAVLALLLAGPLLATIWARRSLSVKVPKGGRVELENASYASREWAVSLKALEVKADSRPVNGTAPTVWVFYYTNTDAEPHYVSVSVRCLDAKHVERSRFEAAATLQPGHPDGAAFEVVARMPEDDWRASTSAKVVVDFLSTPKG